MTTAITTRTAKGSALLWTEEDANFTNLRDAHDNAIAIITFFILPPYAVGVILSLTILNIWLFTPDVPMARAIPPRVIPPCIKPMIHSVIIATSKTAPAI